MIYMSSTSTSQRRGDDPGHVRHRHRRRPGRAERQQPRQAGRGQAAAGSAPPGRDGGEGLVGVPAGARVLLARRPLRRPVHQQLRDAERARRAEARAGHDQRADLRRQGLRDAHLAAARPPGAAASSPPATSRARSTSRTRSSPPARSASRPPAAPQEMVYTITTQGRLSEPRQFEDIIVRANPRRQRACA